MTEKLRSSLTSLSECAADECRCVERRPTLFGKFNDSANSSPFPNARLPRTNLRAVRSQKVRAELFLLVGARCLFGTGASNVDPMRERVVAIGEGHRRAGETIVAV